MVSTHMAWGCYSHICFQRFSQGLYIRTCGIRLHASCVLMAVPCGAGGRQVKYDGMKRMLLSMFMLLMMSAVAFGQQEVTKFLGMPVDGSKEEMIRKLKGKGFKPDPQGSEALVGQFNGTDVNVYVATNNDKVCRIMVCDAHLMGGTDIKIRFNDLCRQFQNNKKYMFISSTGYELPDDEDVGYEITVNDKRYEAIYYQLPSVIDSTAMAEAIMPSLSQYTEEQLANPTYEVRVDMIAATLTYMYELCAKRPVWFMISSLYGQYYITMFYDNEYNRANGEDL